ncbi:MAG TPA: PD-(D/E)XK nuclease family protein [Bacteroidales bacterium]|nr:PD-(D/E)XK nuclease family protein [Bacteroidales bacterium]
MEHLPSFLQLTAEDLYARFGDKLSEVAVVFPNNRARLFFSEHLFKAAGKPVWTPAFITISDLFQGQSDLKPYDTLGVVGLLHEIYLKVSGKEESFDEFYHWGEILLSDFDDVDKNLADARQLFRNIREQAEYTDTLEHLTEDQVDSIRLFFKNFNPDRKTELKERFLENWNILFEVYNNLNDRLVEKGLAYEGMLHRRVVEKLKADGPQGFPFTTYAFVGFNVLNECEKALFSLLNKAGKALFYWDFDLFYLLNPRHEAGRFMRQNLEQFPNCLDKTQFNVFSTTQKNIQFISASTENAGARFLPEWIHQLQQQNDFRPEETAVVLCNEGLLLTVLHSVPDEIRELNVTMGFPLEQTPICNLVNQIAALHADGFLPGKTPRYNHRWVLPILQHPLIRQISQEADAVEQRLKSSNSFRPTVEELQKDALLTTLFTPAQTPFELTACLLATFTQLIPVATEESDSYDPLHAEALFRCHNLTTRLADLLKDNMAELSLQTFRKLLQQVLSKATIPFSGEPVRGLQIMGLLETRNLDFKNILMLSVNEGMLPKGSTDVSFIPYNLRKAFGLTTMEHKDSIFAYYFFRLLQRASTISLVYNTASEGLNRGEMSRFMLQLLMESNHTVSRFNLTSGIELTAARAITIQKTPEIIDTLNKRFVNEGSRPISPTALNSLLECPLRFYFHYVAGLEEPNQVSEDIDGAMLGNFFHHSAEYIYTSILLRKAAKPSEQRTVLQAIQEKTINTELESGALRGMIDAADLEPWLKNIHSIEQVVDLFFKRDFFKLQDHQETPEYNGEQLVRRAIVTGFLKTLLKLDLERVPFQILGLELEVEGELPRDEGHSIRFGGTIDRLDQKDGVQRILDYKTGGNPKNPPSIESLFADDVDRANYVFQIFLYASILHDQDPNSVVCPELLFIHKAAAPDFDRSIYVGSKKEKQKVSDFKPFAETFKSNLNDLIINLFNPETPFVQTPHAEKCTYCDYKNICRR